MLARANRSAPMLQCNIGARPARRTGAREDDRGSGSAGFGPCSTRARIPAASLRSPAMKHEREKARGGRGRGSIDRIHPRGDRRFGIGCAGDTFNVAVYLARAGIDAAFATALGDDPYSEAILALAAAEGVASDLVLRTRGRLPGLAVVDADAAGTRRRYDWRGESPARD